MKHAFLVLLFAFGASFFATAQLTFPQPDVVKHRIKEVTVYKVDCTTDSVYMRQFFGANGLKTKEIDYSQYPKGRTILFEYDTKQRLVKEEIWMADTLNCTLIYERCDTSNWIDCKIVLPNNEYHPYIESSLYYNDLGQLTRKIGKSGFGRKYDFQQKFEYSDSGYVIQSYAKKLFSHSTLTYIYNDQQQLIRTNEHDKWRLNGKTLDREASSFGYSDNGLLDRFKQRGRYEWFNFYKVKYSFREKDGVR
jgi:hypothetical protein